MTEEQAKINEAFEQFPGSSLSKEARQKIVENYGEEIAAQVEKIYQAALDVPVDWNTWTMDSALDAMHALLAREYPWLSQKSRTTLNFMFIMAWK